MSARAAAGLLLCLLAGCPGGKGAPAAAEEKLPPQVTLFGVRLHNWEGSALLSTGRAVKLTYDRVTGNFGAYEALLRLPGAQTGTLDVRAPLAKGNLQTRQAEGSGGIEARAATGLIARTHSARFDGVGLVAQGAEPVEIDGPGYALDAEGGFTFYLVTEELLFEGPVESRLGREGLTP